MALIAIRLLLRHKIDRYCDRQHEWLVLCFVPLMEVDAWALNLAYPASRDLLSRVPSRPAILLFLFSRPIPSRPGTGRDRINPISRLSLHQIKEGTR